MVLQSILFEDHQLFRSMRHRIASVDDVNAMIAIVVVELSLQQSRVILFLTSSPAERVANHQDSIDTGCFLQRIVMAIEAKLIRNGSLIDGVIGTHSESQIRIVLIEAFEQIRLQNYHQKLDTNQ